MARIRAKNTKPELIVRSLLHRRGYRFRTNVRSLPGTPDISFSRRRKVVFVHGCFWHRHEGCSRAAMPSSRVTFWTEKFTRNQERDQLANAALLLSGWSVLVIWECETKRAEELETRLIAFLGAPKFNAGAITC